MWIKYPGGDPYSRSTGSSEGVCGWIRDCQHKTFPRLVTVRVSELKLDSNRKFHHISCVLHYIYLWCTKMNLVLIEKAIYWPEKTLSANQIANCFYLSPNIYDSITHYFICYVYTGGKRINDGECRWFTSGLEITEAYYISGQTCHTGNTAYFSS